MNLPVYPCPNIHYQDEYFLVVEKPSHLLTVPGRGPDKQDCLINRLIPHYPNALIVHRLDMATSGLVVIALSKTAQSSLSQLFALREVQKVYLAIVHGKLGEMSGRVDLPLICDWPNRPKQMVDRINGKAATTDYKVVQFYTKHNTSRIELYPLTGRSHQLRVHMMALGHPIVGDEFYNSPDNKPQSDRLLLHAHKLCFMHPFTHLEITVESTVPF